MILSSYLVMLMFMIILDCVFEFSIMIMCDLDTFSQTYNLDELQD